MLEVLKTIYRGIIPNSTRRDIYNFRNQLRHFAQFRGSDRYCPICKSSSRLFLDYGNPPRAEAICVYCSSSERHRLLWLYIQERTDLFNGRPKRVLHVAAEPSLEPRLRKALKEDYITATLDGQVSNVQMDITNIEFEDESFDVILCSHVLEHVDDDRRAMREFHRVLKPHGWAILLVPIADLDETYEDPSITSEEGRLKAFGQADHVRKYGRGKVQPII